jgi:hypothetical protein
MYDEVMQDLHWSARISEFITKYESWIVRAISITGLSASLFAAFAALVKLLHGVLH